MNEYTFEATPQNEVMPTFFVSDFIMQSLVSGLVLVRGFVESGVEDLVLGGVEEVGHLVETGEGLVEAWNVEREGVCVGEKTVQLKPFFL
jgi:hypothetical protein